MKTISKKYLPKSLKEKNKISKVMEEFRGGKLHSGSKEGKRVSSRSQAIAIALNEARKVSKGRRKH